MKLLLTSAGLSNKSIARALGALAGDGKKVAFIPTAANIEEGSKEWLIEDYVNLQRYGYEVDIVDISALPKETWLPRLESSNIIFAGGGNTFHLMHWMKKSGLEELLPELLKTRVYAGISAGSCIAGPTIYNSVQNLFGEKYDLKIEKGLGLVEFQVIPHLNSPYFSKIRKGNLAAASMDLSESVYALDDNSSLMISGDKIEIVTEGEYLVLNNDGNN